MQPTHHGELQFKQQMAHGIHINPLHSLLPTLVCSNNCHCLELLSPPTAVLSPQQILWQLVTLIPTLALVLTSLQSTIFLMLKHPRLSHGWLASLDEYEAQKKDFLKFAPLEPHLYDKGFHYLSQLFPSMVSLEELAASIGASKGIAAFIKCYAKQDLEALLHI